MVAIDVLNSECRKVSCISSKDLQPYMYLDSSDAIKKQKSIFI